MSLSSLWRENRSSDPGIELASILDAARVMAQSLVPDTQVVFSGVKYAATDRKVVQLTASRIGTTFPVDGHEVDRLMGLTTHEMGHVMFSPDKVRLVGGIVTRLRLHGEERKLLEELVDVLEDIYVDHRMSAFSGYRDYLKVARDDELTDIKSDLVSKLLTDKLTKRMFLNCFAYISLVGGVSIPDNITSDNLAALVEISTISMKLCSDKLDREVAITQAWKIIAKFPDVIEKPKPPPKKEKKNEQKEAGRSEPEAERDDTGGEPEPGDKDEQPEDRGRDSGKSDGDDGEVDGRDKDDNPDETTEPGDDKAEREEDSLGEEGSGEKTEAASDDSETGPENPEDNETEPEASEALPSEQADNGTDENEGQKKSKGAADDFLDSKEGDTGSGSDPEGPGDEAEGVEAGPEEVTGEVAPEKDKEIDFDSISLAEMINKDVEHKMQLPEQIAEDVAEALVGKRADLTQMTSLLANESHGQIMMVVPRDDARVTDEARMSTHDSEERLRRVLQDYRLKETADYHGLRSGRVSARRLHRAGYGDERVFQRREQPEEINLAVALVFDLSGSTCRYSDLIFQTVCATCDAFSKEKVEFIAMGYSEHGGKVWINRLHDSETDKVLLGISSGTAWGGTPSYEGIAAAAAQLLRLGGNKEKILLHFTDGQYGGSDIMRLLLQKIREQGIKDIHVGLGSAGYRFGTMYGDTLKIESIAELPDIIEKLLRKKLGLEV